MEANLERFLRTNEEEAVQAITGLEHLAQLGSLVGIAQNAKLLVGGPRVKFSTFLDQLLQLPPFSQLGPCSQKLGKDCRNWAEELSDQKEAVIHHVDEIKLEEF